MQCQCTCTDPEIPNQKVDTDGNLKVKTNSQKTINVKTADITTSSQNLTKDKQQMSTENKKEKTISVSKDLISRIKGDKTSGVVNYNKNINDKSNNSVHKNKKGQKTSDYVQIGPTYGAGKKYPMSSHGYIVPLNDKTIVPANPNKQEIGNKIAKNEKDIIQMFKSELDIIGKKQTQKKKSNTDNNVTTRDSTAPKNNNNNNNGNFLGNNRPFNINRNNGNNNDNNNQWQTQNRNNGNNNNPNNGKNNNNNQLRKGNNNNNQQWNQSNNNNNNQQWNQNNNNNNNNQQQWNSNNNNNNNYNNNNNNNQQWNQNDNNNNKNNQQLNQNNKVNQPQIQNNNKVQQWNQNNKQNQPLKPKYSKNDVDKLWKTMGSLIVSRLQSMSQPSSQRTRKNGRSFPNESSRNQRRRRKKKVGTTMSPHDMAEEMFGTSEVDPVILEMLAKSNKNKFQL
ncbi:uncharacterized protein DDB_G0287625-like [Mytilus edulis]|uniref:uncharacterized protein DDB_G0287625-like n=1 Tax=Mytilus edulis TaxID=6550 RepID=UPI0039F00B8C